MMSDRSTQNDSGEKLLFDPEHRNKLPVKNKTFSTAFHRSSDIKKDVYEQNLKL